MALSDVLAHYTSTQTLINHIGPEGRLKLTPLSQSNDPAESYSWDFSYSGSGNIDFLSVQREFQQIAKSFIQERVKICCFCQPNRRADVWFKPRMWATYGDRSRGVALLFSKKKLHSIAEKALNTKTYWAGRVRYVNLHTPDTKGRRTTEQILSRCVFLDRVSQIGALAELQRMIKNNWEDFFFFKHSDWKDEREYRIAVFDESNEILKLPIEGALMEIVLGPDVDRSKIPAVVEARNHLEPRPFLWLVDRMSDGTFFTVPAPFYSEETIPEGQILDAERRVLHRMFKHLADNS